MKDIIVGYKEASGWRLSTDTKWDIILGFKDSQAKDVDIRLKIII